VADPGSTIKSSALGVIILGAGASVRMGRPKLLLPWKGTTIIGHLIQQWQEMDAGQITVVCRPDDEPLFAELDRRGVSRENRIINPQPERGMFSSIQGAANWPGWRPGLMSWAIVLGDQPQIQPETLRNLLAFHAQNSLAICQPSHARRAGHPVLLPQTAFARLKTTAAPTLKIFLNQNTGSIVQCPVIDPGLALDLDTPDDYNRLTSTTHGK
jgi:molybdenum cofactor cytidylyltransferase